MGRIKYECPECESPISRFSKHCMTCGYDPEMEFEYKKSRNIKWALFIFFGSPFVVALFYGILPNPFSGQTFEKSIFDPESKMYAAIVGFSIMYILFRFFNTGAKRFLAGIPLILVTGPYIGIVLSIALVIYINKKKNGVLFL